MELVRAYVRGATPAVCMYHTGQPPELVPQGMLAAQVYDAERQIAAYVRTGLTAAHISLLEDWYRNSGASLAQVYATARGKLDASRGNVEVEQGKAAFWAWLQMILKEGSQHD